MQFDLTKLPKKPLSLCEMVTFLAWGVAMTGDELKEFGHPAEMAQKSEWDAQLEVCRKQALTNLELSAAEEERRKQALAELDLSGLIIGIDESWPSACQELHQRWLGGQQRLKDQKAKLAQSAEDWRQAALYGHLKVSGLPFGADYCDTPIEIPRARFKHYRPDWESDTLEPNWKVDGRGRPARRIDNPSYYDVHSSRESFVDLLNGRADANQPVVAEGAQSAVDEQSAPKKRRPGPRSRFEEIWQKTLKPLAIDIYAEIGPYDRAADALQSNHIDRIIDQFKRDHKGKKCPSKSWLKPKLREIQPELDERIKQVDGASEGRD